MNRTISFFVRGEPKAQPRPKAFARKFGSKWSARVYDPGTAENWKSQIAMAAKELFPATPTEDPICLELDFKLPRPKSHHNSKGHLKESAPVYHTNKPDADNLEKAVMDALTQLGAWRDDSQVCIKRTTKRYVSEGFVGCCILIQTLSHRGENAASTTHNA